MIKSTIALALICFACLNPKETLSPGWHQGPPPNNTWGYGGVVLKGQNPDSGFMLAAFRGKKVMLFDNSSEDFDKTNTIIKNDEVGYWNASVKNPIVIRPPAPKLPDPDIVLK